MRIRNLVRLREQEKALRDLNATLGKKVEKQVELILRGWRTYEQQLLEAKEAAASSLRLKTAIKFTEEGQIVLQVRRTGGRPSCVYKIVA